MMKSFQDTQNERNKSNSNAISKERSRKGLDVTDSVTDSSTDSVTNSATGVPKTSIIPIANDFSIASPPPPPPPLNLNGASKSERSLFS